MDDKLPQPSQEVFNRARAYCEKHYGPLNPAHNSAVDWETVFLMMTNFHAEQSKDITDFINRDGVPPLADDVTPEAKAQFVHNITQACARPMLMAYLMLDLRDHISTTVRNENNGRIDEYILSFFQIQDKDIYNLDQWVDQYEMLRQRGNMVNSIKKLVLLIIAAAKAKPHFMSAKAFLPVEGGAENKVIVLHQGKLYWGWKNHDADNPMMFLEDMVKCFSTLDCHWLDINGRGAVPVKP